MAFNGLCNILEKYHSSDSVNIKFTEDHPGFTASEISIKDYSPIKTTSVLDNCAVEWLRRSFNSRSTTTQGRLTSIRIVWVDFDDSKRPYILKIKERNKDLILDNFDIEQAYAYSFTSDRSLFCSPITQAPRPMRSSFSFSSYRSLRLSWTFNYDNSCISAFCIGGRDQCQRMQFIL